MVATRQALPSTRESITHKFNIDKHEAESISRDEFQVLLQAGEDEGHLGRVGRGLTQDEAGAAALEVVEALGEVCGVFAQHGEAMAEPGAAHVEGVAEVSDGGGLGAQAGGDGGGEALQKLRRAGGEREQAHRAA